MKSEEHAPRLAVAMPMSRKEVTITVHVKGHIRDNFAVLKPNIGRMNHW